MMYQLLTGERPGFVNYFRKLLDLFYPRLCLACDAHLPPGKEIICLFCQHRLPRTDYHLLEENPFTERFWGRLPLQHASSLYHFNKGGRVQRLIHQLKYHHQPEIGHQLGLLHGRYLREGGVYAGVDLIVPVPLHPRKMHSRGYNQSDHYARGLAESMNIPWSDKVLVRKVFTNTQTQKSRQERLANVEEVFGLQHPEEIAGRYILLVDDVITTGATLEACGSALLRIPDVRLSLATIGFAN